MVIFNAGYSIFILSNVCDSFCFVLFCHGSVSIDWSYFLLRETTFLFLFVWLKFIQFFFVLLCYCCFTHAYSSVVRLRSVFQVSFHTCSRHSVKPFPLCNHKYKLKNNSNLIYLKTSHLGHKILIKYIIFLCRKASYTTMLLQNTECMTLQL